MLRPIGVYNLPSLITLAGLLCAMVACAMIVSGAALIAPIFLIWAGIFDLFDGLVARKLGVSGRAAAYGVQIDTVVDIVSFGVVPCIIYWGYVGVTPVTVVFGSFYVIAAAIRLAAFTSEKTENIDAVIVSYTGLPVTYASLIFGISFYTQFYLQSPIFLWVMTLIVAVTGGLFISRLQIRKPNKFVYILMPVLALVFTVLWWLKFHQSGAG